MAVLRRVTALFACVLLLQLVLVGSGYACALMAPVGDDIAVATMDAAVADEAEPSERDGCADAMRSPVAPTGAPAPDDVPCSLPWAPAGCHGGPCAPAAIVAGGPALAADRPHMDNRASLDPLPPVPVARAPELPPPRA